MDELLSLFDNDGLPSAPTDTQNASPTHEQSHAQEEDAFSACFSDAFPHAKQTTVTPSPPSRLHSTAQVAAPAPPANKTHASRNSHSNSNATPTDPLTNLRITNRHTSLATTLDLFSSYEYKSCSMLLSMSKSDWDDVTSKGKTNLATAGVITNGVHSRFSKAGKAYALLSLGDVSTVNTTTGNKGANIYPSVTVFLFGEALQLLSSKRCLERGYAVGVLGPNQLKNSTGKNNNNQDTITLSVSNPDQLILMGKCADVDRCRGTVRKRTVSEYGNNRFEDVRCSCLVNVRVGGYCLEHRRQGLNCSKTAQYANGKSANSNGLTFMQRQRMEGTATTNTVQLGKRKDLNVVVSTKGAADASCRVSEALSQAGLLSNNPHSAQSTNPFSVQSAKPQSAKQMLQRAPMHMKKTSKNEIWSNTSTPLSNLNGARANPYKAVKPPNAAKSNMLADDLLGAALQRKRQKTSLASQSKQKPTKPMSKPLKIFHTEGYDGSVAVPKPNPLFKHASRASPAATITKPNKGLSSDQTRVILDRQKSLAGWMKSRDVTTDKPKKAQHTILSNSNPSDDPFASTFHSSEPLDREAILNAKSRFSSAATAEEYARARSVVQQLEVRECELDRRKERSDKGRNVVTVGWACKTCNTKMVFELRGCVRARHDVRQIRELRKMKSGAAGSKEERMERHGKDAKDGGLTLGSGLEWSWRK